MQMEGKEKYAQAILADLERQAQWARIVPFLEHHCADLQEKRRRSPATYAKHKRWLLNTERLTIAQVLVLREMMGKTPLSQGELVRLLGGNPYREGVGAEEQKEILALNQYWANQIRNNIRPLLADYFGLMEMHWEGEDKPGTGEYSIHASPLLIRFFTEHLYA